MQQVQPRTGPAAERLTAADLVTSLRIALAAALAVVALAGGSPWLIGVLAGPALLSDFVDGRLARATGTTTRLGARLDQEADALLVLVLSVIVASGLGAWVLALGLARYAFGAVFLVVPALRTPPTTARPWCRTVAAATGIVLAVVATVPLPPPAATAAVAVVGVLLAESFLHEAVDRWRAPRPGLVVPFPTVLAFVVVWLAMLAPANRDGPTVRALLGPPVELLLVVAIALLPGRRLRGLLAALLGLLLAAALLVTVLDASFQAVFDRDFDPVGDWSYLGPGVGVLGDSIGPWWARLVAVLAGLAALGLVAGVPAATVHLVAALRRHAPSSVPAAAVLATTWVACAAIGLPVASSGATQLTVAEVGLIRADVADSRAFSRQIATDPYAARAAAKPQRLLAGLAGKDVLLVFVESYGRVAVQDTSYSRRVDAVLDRGTRRLDRSGYSARSAFLTSPTFGAGSWLAHSTLQSGLWVDSERRYRQLLGQHRLTLTSLFGAAGWHTVFDVPADTEDWPEGQAFYGFQQYDDSRSVGYAGPTFGYAPVPDQYTLEHFRREQLAPAHRRPVMAEIDLVSSHHPWTPLPRMVPWDRVGDGSVYDTMPQTPTSAEVFADPDAVRRMYGRSVAYSWRVLVGFLTTYRDPDLVVVVLGDHQPHGYVSGEDPGHDVPISVIAQDPAVMRRTAGWGWQPGLHPSPDATVWRMDAFRDRFLAAFSR